jgi:hypothetical protein
VQRLKNVTFEEMVRVIEVVPAKDYQAPPLLVGA